VRQGVGREYLVPVGEGGKWQIRDMLLNKDRGNAKKIMAPVGKARDEGKQSRRISKFMFVNLLSVLGAVTELCKHTRGCLTQRAKRPVSRRLAASLPVFCQEPC
jgi:hypothetical protein